MSFIDDYKKIKDKVKTDITQTELIFEEALTRCGVRDKAAAEIYGKLYDILKARDEIHEEIEAFAKSFGKDELYKKYKEDVSVTGFVTERICEIALRAAGETRYADVPKNWKWIGDFAILGTPFNVFVSVKSYKAKERLLVSGTGQNAAPVIGYGLFNDEKEWSPDRVKQYKHRGFVAIYMPNDLYKSLAEKIGKKYPSKKGYPSTDIKNIYDNPLLRKIEDFPRDLKKMYELKEYELDLSKF